MVGDHFNRGVIATFMPAKQMVHLLVFIALSALLLFEILQVVHSLHRAGAGDKKNYWAYLVRICYECGIKVRFLVKRLFWALFWVAWAQKAGLAQCLLLAY